MKKNCALGIVCRTMVVVFFACVFFGAAPVAGEESADTCDASSEKKIRDLNESALNLIVRGNLTQALWMARRAEKLAGKTGCLSHRVIAVSGFVLGYVDWKAEKRKTAGQYWEMTLSVDPEFVFPERIRDEEALAAFKRFKDRVETQTRIQKEMMDDPEKSGVCSQKVLGWLRVYIGGISALLDDDRNSEAEKLAAQALKLAFKQNCTRQNETAVLHLLAGVVEFRFGARRLDLKHWQSALRLNPRVDFPKEMRTPVLVAHLGQLRHGILQGEWRSVYEFMEKDQTDGCAMDSDCERGHACRDGKCVSVSAAPAGHEGQPVHGDQHGVQPGGARGAPGAENRDRLTFSDKSTFELGGSVGVHWSRQKAGRDSVFKSLSLKGDLYLGYFPANRFVLGTYITGGVERADFGNNEKSTGYMLGAAAAPGFAIPVSMGSFFYLDGLLGFNRISYKMGSFETKGNFLLVGSELGFKLLINEGVLLRLGFQPGYLRGKTQSRVSRYSSSEKSSGVRIYAVLGFSYWK